MTTIYIVEDDENIRSMVKYVLMGNEFEAVGFDSAPPFFEQIDNNKPDLILLDIMLPGEDGLSILEKLRNRPDTKNIPVLMLTAKSEEMDKVRGLDLGADDYMTKPFGILELLSRIRAILRRTGNIRTDENAEQGDIMEYNGLRVDKSSHIVTVFDKDVKLTKKEFQLLTTLMENRKKVMTREQLMSIVWGFDYSGETRTVDIHVNTLRKKIGDDGSFIETIRGIGYKFI